MRYLIFLGHPAHFHLFKNLIVELNLRGHQVKVLIRKKDILDDLCIESGLEFENILPEFRKKGFFSTLKSYLIKYRKISVIIKKFKPHLLLGSEPTLTHLGWYYKIPSFVFSEDDVKIIPQFAKIAYPFVDVIMSPKTCNAGKWEEKKIGYEGYHKMAYLHPKVFKPNKYLLNEINVNEKYFVIRFAQLNAYHDKNRTGITNKTALKIISLLNNYGRVYITSERDLGNEFENYKLKINPLYIHHLLYYAHIYIGDSQSMAVESALLGTPCLRLNDFAGEIGVLNELENKYDLTHGFKTIDSEKMFQKLQEMLLNKNLKDEYKFKREKMLTEKINVLDYFIWFIENYPESKLTMKINPDFQYKFL